MEDYAHVEGGGNVASGDYAHAEGSASVASGENSHAEGQGSTASGLNSSATGTQAKALHDGSRVEADGQLEDVNSTTTNQYTARFQNGYEFKGGTANFEGDLQVAGVSVSAGGGLPTSTAEDSFLVADNSGGWTQESGDTARTSLGLGSGDTPTFANAEFTEGLQVGGVSISAGGGLPTSTSENNFLVADNAGGWTQESDDTARTSLGLGSSDAPTFANANFTEDLQVGGVSVSVGGGLPTSTGEDNFLVANDSGGWDQENGATARTSLGLGSGDTPTFANAEFRLDSNNYATLTVGNGFTDLRAHHPNASMGITADPDNCFLLLTENLLSAQLNGRMIEIGDHEGNFNETEFIVNDADQVFAFGNTPEITVQIEGGLRFTETGQRVTEISTSVTDQDSALPTSGAVYNFKKPTTTVTTTTYTALITDSVILVDESEETTVTLMSAATAGDGFKLTIKSISNTANVIIDGNGSDTIDGAATATLTSQYESVTVISNGSDWYTI